MKIFFSKREYHTLVEMIEVASWVIADNETEENKKKRYDEMEQKILSYAKDFGLDEHVVFDKEMNRYFTTKDFEENYIIDHIDAYDNDTFWEELINRLAQRDFVAEHSDQDIKEMDIREKFQKLAAYERKYSQEFKEYGLERIIIKTKE